MPRADEFERIQQIERDAGRMFVEFGMPEIAEHPPFGPAILGRFRDAGAVWVVGDPAMGYLVAEPVDGCVHIEQVSVDPAFGGRGLGRDLIEHVASRARRPVTLTTFVEVPWNGPYYERLGFRRLADDELTDGLRRIRQAEADMGLDKWPRMAMRREPAPATRR